MLTKYVLILSHILILTLVVLSKKHKKEYNVVSMSPPIPLSIEPYGNCYAYDRPLVGRCVRYRDCISAIQARHEIIPLECPSPSNSHDRYVCCPHGGYVVPEPRQSKSERACWKAYIRGSNKRRRRQSTNTDEVEAIEPPIRRVNFSDTGVVGGRLTQPDEHPYMCALGWRSNNNTGKAKGKTTDRYVFNCGCVLIERKYALTAAHCARIGGESPEIVLIGGVDLNDTQSSQIIRIKEMKIHPNYDDESIYNDLAIIKLEKRAHQPIACLWTNEAVPEHQLTALGYGQTSFAGPPSNQLLQVQLYPLNNQQCAGFLVQGAEKLKNGIGPGQLCAGDYSGRMDTCQGDSGGPLVMFQRDGHHRLPYVIGITSLGGICASGAPGIYTRISHYIPWIERRVWK